MLWKGIYVNNEKYVVNKLIVNKDIMCDKRQINRPKFALPRSSVTESTALNRSSKSTALIGVDELHGEGLAA